jgi:hypothetical protein
VIFKPSYGAFYDTPLETILRNLNRDTIIVVGTLTNFCCGTTARQGYERGFYVVFCSDLIATDDPDMQEAELSVLRKGFARIMTASAGIRVALTTRASRCVSFLPRTAAQNVSACALPAKGAWRGAHEPFEGAAEGRFGFVAKPRRHNGHGQAPVAQPGPCKAHAPSCHVSGGRDPKHRRKALRKHRP